jgi:hypothetical protein
MSKSGVGLWGVGWVGPIQIIDINFNKYQYASF